MDSEPHMYHEEWTQPDTGGKRHAGYLQCLYAIARILTGQAGQSSMPKQVLSLLEERLNMQRATLMLLSADNNELMIEASSNLCPEKQEQVRYQRGEGIIGRVLQTGEYAIVPRISSEPAFRGLIHDRDERSAEALSFLCVPIAIDREVVGTLSADLPLAGGDELKEAQQFLSIVAGMIAYDVKARRAANLERKSFEAEQLRMRSALGERFRPENIIGNSFAMRGIYERIHLVAGSGATVLIRGESGTGKELVASAIHYKSERAGGPFIRVNCSALNEQLIESELFGHERGAFTGAHALRKGRIEEAEGGTLFLDEIGEFSLTTQVKLLRVLQEREFERVGSSRPVKADIRVIAATNKNLEDEVTRGRFRQDLFYRINVFPVYLPPLRERKDDILLLADHFARKRAAAMGKSIRRIGTNAIDMMMAYHWPGNVRELENCIEYATVLSNDGVIHGHHLPPTLQLPEDESQARKGNFNLRIEQLEKDMIMDALKRTKGNISAAARHLGLTARIVRYKIDKYGIEYQSIFRKPRR